MYQDKKILERAIPSSSFTVTVDNHSSSSALRGRARYNCGALENPEENILAYLVSYLAQYNSYLIPNAASGCQKDIPTVMCLLVEQHF